jgi:hypothetical protein
VNFDYLTQLLENYGFDLVSPEEAATTLIFPMPDGTATFDGMFHQMEVDCKKKRDEMGGGGGGTDAGVGGSGDTWTRQCRQEYGSALYMTPEEKQISFYNRYFIFRKNRSINAKQLKSSFLTYAGLQEQQDRAESESGVDDDIALQKITKASMPIDVASKPAIAAHILEQQKTEKQLVVLQGSETGAAGAKSSTMKIKPKPKKTTTVKTSVAAAAAAAAAPEPEIEDAPSAPIAQIEKKIQRRTKKTKSKDEGDASSGTGADAAASEAQSAPAPKPKRQTKKKTDL